MFTSLKNRIKEETGTDVTLQSRFVSQRENELSALKLSHTELERQLEELGRSLADAKEERVRLETTNVLLEESLRLAQEQKDVITEEHDKIENSQHKENEKLKHLLLFKDQEAADRAAALRNAQVELDKYRQECCRLQGLESQLEDLKDELERVRHTAQTEKTQLTNSLASVEEEKRHLKMRLEIVEQSRTGFSDETTDDQVKSLVQERKLLEQRLEEAHLHLIDIKSSWSGQNLSLETQVARLSRQVAEEAADKRKAVKMRDESLTKAEEVEKELEGVKKEVSEKNNKIRLLNEELEEMNASLNEMQKKIAEKETGNKKEIENFYEARDQLQAEFSATQTLLRDQLKAAEEENIKLKSELKSVQEKADELTVSLEKEKSERVKILLKNAELTQNEESLRQDLKQERDELDELLEQTKTLQRNLKIHEKNEKDLMLEIDGLTRRVHEKEHFEKEFQRISSDLQEKDKSIKVLNQRLVDMKKTLQEEIKGNRSRKPNDLNNNNNIAQEINRIPSSSTVNGVVTMDEINFKYLKHVIIKFITCRDIEAKRHLIRAVSTLLQLTNEEERLLDENEMYKWKSWIFGGSRSDVGQWSSS